jgi:hypothetical protein
VDPLVQHKRLKFLEIYDMTSLRIQSLNGALKEPSAYDKVAIKLNLGGYKIKNNVEIFGIDNKLVKWWCTVFSPVGLASVVLFKLSVIGI